MKKYHIFIIVFLLSFSCKKTPTQDEIIAEELKGTWNTVSIKIDNVESFSSALSAIKTTFFDIEENKGRYNLKIFILDSLYSETEGNLEVLSNGTKLKLDEDGVKEESFADIVELTDNTLKTKGLTSDDKEIVYIGAR